MCKIASVARNGINSVPQTPATTFAFSSVFILLLWYMDSTVYLPWFALLSVSVYMCIVLYSKLLNVTSFLPTFPLSYILILSFYLSVLRYLFLLQYSSWSHSRNADLIYFLPQIQIVFTSDDDLNYFYVRCRYKVFLLVMRI